MGGGACGRENSRVYEAVVVFTLGIRARLVAGERRVESRMDISSSPTRIRWDDYNYPPCRLSRPYRLCRLCRLYF